MSNSLRVFRYPTWIQWNLNGEFLSEQIRIALETLIQSLNPPVIPTDRCVTRWLWDDCFDLHISNGANAWNSANWRLSRGRRALKERCFRCEVHVVDHWFHRLTHRFRIKSSQIESIAAYSLNNIQLVRYPRCALWSETDQLWSLRFIGALCNFDEIDASMDCSHRSVHMLIFHWKF